ncbi:RNA polymerase sigma factor [Maribellus maritimus]|uniref:RNA polymerase sigma factor n=1 Tax=Maribellus maritimus TaxID=2870838 RepID=UPI001EEB2201|nr:sigma-70 family RNA polymerase sigma factor [Maribellus maritimus]MCG6190052.1 sigma-70 family RNA polymerase sigma factor [Maribellus maritimus]
MGEKSNNDFFLWRRLKAGDTEAFNELYNRYADILFSFGQLYSKDKETVKDCIHDLFFELYKYRKNLSDTNNIKNYLFLSLRRKIQTSKNVKLSLIYSDNITESENKSNISFPDIHDGDENLERLKIEIAQLPDRQKEALILRFHSELSYNDIAEIMDISVESVRKNIYRSVKTLRTKLSSVNDKKSIILLLFKILIDNT